MKVYRAIEFSKLIWMISDYAALRWNQARSEHEPLHSHTSNWWLSTDFELFKDEMISDVIYQGQDKFFEKSLEFNAMQGGRFNPARSFGVLYTSSDPLVAALEVLYHQFMSTYPLYRRINSSSKQFTSSFNIKVPRQLKILIVAFEIDLADEYCQTEVCGDLESLKEDCRRLGFERYIGEKFSRDFIFGNDYEVSRIIGSYLHTFEDPSYKVPSARISFDIQDQLGIRNYLIPERQYDPAKIDLTGNYYEYVVSLDFELEDTSGHQVDIEVRGLTSETFSIKLQPIPRKGKPISQHIRYEPNLNDGSDKNRFHRLVEIQRFYVK